MYTVQRDMYLAHRGPYVALRGTKSYLCLGLVNLEYKVFQLNWMFLYSGRGSIGMGLMWCPELAVRQTVILIKSQKQIKII